MAITMAINMAILGLLRTAQPLFPGFDYQ